MNEPKVIAEIGCNHKGEMDIAYEMIKMASIFCNVDGVKFQKRSPRELLTEEEYNAPHPNPVNSYGNTYGEHREMLEFDLEQHRQLKKWCEDFNLLYSVSVWDMTSAKEMVSLKPQMLKIPSACNLKFDLLGYICDEFKGSIHLSLGMTTREEEKRIIDFLGKKNRNQDLIIYACTSGYPIAFEDICLLEISRLKEAYGNIVQDIGFSGHHLGIAADVAALALGAVWVERHFTLDRTWKGTDHAASLEPDGMRRLTRDLKSVYKALNQKPQEILEVEEVQRNKLKRL